jgi:hypothetical protein
MTWGQTPASYVTPTVRVVSDEPWLADVAVSSWSLERELVASTIPGNIRSRTGLSIGSASVTVANRAGLMTPWSADLSRRVVAKGSLQLMAGETGDEFPIGSWMVDPTSGSLLSREVPIDLLEAQYAGRRLPARVAPLANAPFNPDSPVDAAWLIGHLAAQAGFHPVPPPVASTLASIPLYGSDSSNGGAYNAVLTTTGWDVLPGDAVLAPENGSEMSLLADVRGRPIVSRLETGGSIFLTLNVVGTVHIVDTVQGWHVQIVNSGGTGSVAVSNVAGAVGTPVSFTPGLSEAWPTRVQVELQRNFFEVGYTAPTWTSAQVRARSASDAAWSSWATDTTDFAAGSRGIELIYVAGGVSVPTYGMTTTAGQFSALQVTTEADDALWTPSLAYLKPLGRDAGLPWVPDALDVWTAIQNHCSAWLAGAILGADGVIRILDRDDLAGAGIAGDPLDVGMELADLPWEQDPGDVVDRVEVTFAEPVVTSADVGSTTLAPEAWRPGDVVTAPANQTITISAVFENVAAQGLFTGFIAPGITPIPEWSQFSSIEANAAPDGSGAAVDNLAVSAVQTSVTTARVTVTNPNAYPVYLVNSSGDSALVLRAQTVATYDTPQVIERGASAEDALQPLTVDLTPYVQTRTAANEVADYLWSRLSTGPMWKVSGVKCRLDWSLDIGQIKALTHERTGLTAKVLITKVSLDGGPGEIGQSLDLVLLPPTWADFDSAWASGTWDDFDATWSGRTWDDFDAAPLDLGA